jgi:hypothetical protein
MGVAALLARDNEKAPTAPGAFPALWGTSALRSRSLSVHALAERHAVQLPARRPDTLWFELDCTIRWQNHPAAQHFLCTAGACRLG